MDGDSVTEHLRIVGSRRYGTLSPLRYPGGKAALAGLFADIISALDIANPRYVEPYAGGAGAGIALLRQGIVDHLLINDIDPAVYAFWRAITEHNAEFVDLVYSTPLTIPEWQRQRDTYRSGIAAGLIPLGFAFFYLNRTNRSGVLNAGVIGGQSQNGTYKIDARFNRETLAERLLALGQLAEQITVSDLDGRTVIQQQATDASAFMYIDPPYVRAGSQLYLNAFDGRDHKALSEIIKSVNRAHWLVTYDTAPIIEHLYNEEFQCILELSYSGHKPGRAEELLIASSSVATAIEHIYASTMSQTSINA